MGVHHNPFIVGGITGGNTILLDRDGVINEERNEYVKSVAELEIIEEALLGLKLLREAGYRVVVLTNQSVVGRGIIDEEELREIHETLFKRVEEASGRIDRIYFCPHKPEDNCFCRKPNPGLFIGLKEDMGINLTQIFYVGDKETDIMAGKAIGCKTAFVGKGVNFEATPDIIAKNLYEAVVKILAVERRRDEKCDCCYK